MRIHKLQINSREGFLAQFDGARVQKNRDCYTGPGTYFFKEYQERCPKGCCYDNVVEAQTREQRLAELEDQKRELETEIENCDVGI